MTARTIAALAALACFAAQPTFASSNVVTLGASKTANVVVLDEIAPTKTFKPLELGDLRTRTARLPGGTTSRADRMRMRAERALERRKEMDAARRKKAAEGDD